MQVNNSSQTTVIQSVYNRQRLIEQGQSQDIGQQVVTDDKKDSENGRELSSAVAASGIAGYEDAHNYLKEQGLLKGRSRQDRGLDAYRQIQGSQERDEIEDYFKVSVYA